VVLLDVQLGEEDGLSLAVWMHQQPALKDIPVIAVTAQVMTSTVNVSLRAGAIASCPNL